MPQRRRLKPLHGLDEILSLFAKGTTVVLHSGFAEPAGLGRELARNADALHGVNVYSLMPMGGAPYAGAAAARHLAVHSFFPGKALRAATNSGQVRVHRTALSKIPGLFATRRIRADILMLQVSPPNAAGEMSLGISVDYMRAVLDQAPVVIAEINRRMPRTCGDTIIREDQVDYVFEDGTGPQTTDANSPDDVDRRIADNVAELVADGAVLQTGIGAIPDLVLPRLTHLSDLGIHTGIITNAVVPLLKCGAVTNATKPRFRGQCVATMAGGTQAFYDFLHENPEIAFHPCSVTHDFETLAGIEGLCAINGALQVDLAGNVNAEILDGRVISAPGGFPDFARGAAAAAKGVSITALRATSKGGDRSNIVPILPAGAPTTVAAAHIDFVVTEHGIARLSGLDREARRTAMLSVAAPEFRRLLKNDGLAADAEDGDRVGG